jgi:hypothetical protein
VTIPTYDTEEQRVEALRAAMVEWRRSGVLKTPQPVALRDHEAIRYPRLPGTAPLPAPAPAAASDEEVGAVVREALGAIDDAQAASLCARRLHEAGATDAQVIAAMREVAHQREAAAVRDVAAVRPVRRDTGFLR